MEQPLSIQSVPPARPLTSGRSAVRAQFYVSYVDRLDQHLLLSVDWVVAARPAEDAARGRRPAVCMLVLACAHACASPSRDPVPFTVSSRLLPW